MTICYNEKFMREAVRLAEESMDSGGGPFGAVIAEGDKIIARGQNRVVPNNDPTAHAEMIAIRKACALLETNSLNGLVIYASCEPCPMCLGAIYWSRLDRVYYASTRHDAATAGFDDSLFYDEFGKTSTQRQISSEHVLSESAIAIFARWTAKTDKNSY